MLTLSSMENLIVQCNHNHNSKIKGRLFLIDVSEKINFVFECRGMYIAQNCTF